MTDDNWPTFECSYTMDGKLWGFHIYAKDWEDAHRRLAAIAMTGKVDGVHYATIPAYRGWWVPIWCRFKNWRRA